ncbi:CehA/McbA family metallohydrolase [Novosphingobium sp.]|uniref:CehA/McbA family metallohydrolase n=1 Tax=Novosphingobium sp. TaxID=1874826 RepID=UPI003B51733B
MSWGKDVLARTAHVSAHVAAGAGSTIAVPIDVLFDPPAHGWYAADLHHHADQAEAVTPAPDLARSQLAAGLDLLFVSDHDSVVNHPLLQAIAMRRGVPFLPGIEISTSWAHFNAYPITPGKQLGIDTSRTTVQAVFADARRMGAEVVEINHPFIPYGYFTSVAGGVAPGGFDPAFDLVEINASVPTDDHKVLKSLWDDWTAGRAHYLAAGTDVHDVWNSLSGKVRTYAHVAGPVTALGYARALKAGHGYVTSGPLIDPDTMFGDTLSVRRGAPFALGFGLHAVDGLARVSLIHQGSVVKTMAFPASDQSARAVFPLTADRAGWYALIVEDTKGRRAYTDPVWITMTGQ